MEPIKIISIFFIIILIVALLIFIYKGISSFVNMMTTSDKEIKMMEDNIKMMREIHEEERKQLKRDIIEEYRKNIRNKIKDGVI